FAGRKFDVQCWMFDVRPAFSPESNGCLVAYAVFKTVVGPFHGSRQVRFLPSPPIRMRNADCGMRIATSTSTHDIGFIPHSALRTPRFEGRRWSSCRAHRFLN